MTWEPFRFRTIAPIGLGWLLLFLVIVSAGWLAVSKDLKLRAAEADRHAYQEASKAAHSYASYLTQVLTSVDQIMLTIKYGWERSDGKLSLEDMLKRGTFVSGSNFYVSIFDRDGTMVSTSVPNRGPLNVATWPFFSQPKAAATDRLFIGDPSVGVFTRRPILRFSRALLDRNGQFEGVVLCSVSLKYLTEIYMSLGLRRNDFLGIVGIDGQDKVVRFGDRIQPPGGGGWTGLPRLPSSSGEKLWEGHGQFPDGRARYVGWASVPGFPLIAVAGLDREDMFAAYSAYRTEVIRTAIAATAVLAVFVLVAATLGMRLRWRNHLHAQMQATYRLATESGTDAFYIVEPAPAGSANIPDYVIVDCNERGAQFLAGTPEGVVGRRISSLYGGQLPTDVGQLLHEAMERETLEGEVKLAKDSPLHIRWAHYKCVRSGNRLAIALRDVSGAKEHVRELERRSNEDTLTGLPNRQWLNSYLPRSVTAAAERDGMLAVLFIDLDGFKRVNDMMGHDIGDELLRNVARRLEMAVRPGDHVVRMGGDEFVVVIENIGEPSDAAHVADRILHAFRESFKLSKGTHSVGTSIGISVFPVDGTDAAQLVKSADIAMYSVKTSGKRNYRFYDRNFDAEVNARHTLEIELRHAIDGNQMVMYYQPRVDVATGKMTSMEALVRWAHPTRGIVEPNEFIPLAEETGIIVELGKQVIDKVCSQISSWSRQGQPLVPVSINVSARQFDEGNIGQQLAASIAHYRIDSRLVELELTESAMSQPHGDVPEKLGRIQKMGVKLLVDDFGTGYSSLSQLQQLDFDILKVDRVFTAGLEKSKEGTALYRAIITMAHELGMRVVAEGVETVEQLEVLRTLCCDEIQGFLVSRPAPPPRLQEALLAG